MTTAVEEYRKHLARLADLEREAAQLTAETRAKFAALLARTDKAAIPATAAYTTLSAAERDALGTPAVANPWLARRAGALACADSLYPEPLRGNAQAATFAENQS